MFSDCRVQDLDEVEMLIRRQPRKPDFIIYAGDDICRFKQPGGRDYFEAIANLSTHGFGAVAGNDDAASAKDLITGEKVYDLHEKPVVLGDIAFIGQEGAVLAADRISVGNLLYTEKQIRAHLEAQLSQTKAKTVVLVSHAPPFGVLDKAIRFGSESIGSRALRKTINNHPRIQLIVSGHVHNQGEQAQVLRGRAICVNVASNDSRGAPLRSAIAEITPGSPVEVAWLRKTFPRHDLRNIYPIGPKQQRMLKQNGISTVGKLAKCQLVNLLSLVGNKTDKERLAALYCRAQAICTQSLFPIKEISPIVDPIYIDIETDSLAANIVWLIGCYRRGQKPVQFVMHYPDCKGERRMLADFLDYLSEAPGPIVSYSGSRFDARGIIGRLREQGFKTPARLTQDVDFIHTLRRCIALPGRDYTLKHVGSELGFKFRHPEKGGADVARAYLKGIRRKGKRHRVPKWCLEYNQDDLLALDYIVGRSVEISAGTCLIPRVGSSVARNVWCLKKGK